MRFTENQIAYLLLGPLIALEFSISLYPILYSLWMSFYDINLFTKQNNFVWLAQYAKAFADSFFLSSGAVSIRFIVEVTLLVTFLSVAIALILNEKFKGSAIVRVLVIMPWALSEWAVAITGTFFLNSNFGLLNGILVRLGIIPTNLLWLNETMVVEWLSIFFSWNFAPLGAFFILSALQTIPEDFYKAAKVDGANAFQRFRHVTFPFIRYAVLITLVLSTIEASRAVVIVLGMTGGGPGNASQTATFYIFRVFLRELNLGYGAAMSWIVLVFVLIATVVYFTLLTRRR